MNDNEFINQYIASYKKIIYEHNVNGKIIEMKNALLEMKARGSTLFFFGNGASASIASHCALDFTKQAKIRSMCINDASLITALGNDFGYEKWIEKAIEFYLNERDILVLISSSGKSPNIVNASNYAKSKGITLITFTGFNQDNSLKLNGDINFWVNSKVYNLIESIHMFWLTTVCDLIIGKAEYSVS